MQDNLHYNYTDNWKRVIHSIFTEEQAKNIYVLRPENGGYHLIVSSTEDILTKFAVAGSGSLNYLTYEDSKKEWHFQIGNWPHCCALLTVYGLWFSSGQNKDSLIPQIVKFIERFGAANQYSQAYFATSSGEQVYQNLITKNGFRELSVINSPKTYNDIRVNVLDIAGTEPRTDTSIYTL